MFFKGSSGNISYPDFAIIHKASSNSDCVLLICFSEFIYPNETNSTLRWLPDPSIEFAAGKHIALICVAILILMVGLVYTFLIFSWRWLRECKVCKWTNNQRLHSFIDTYHIPHTGKHRYWTGLLLLVRIVVFILSAFSISIDPRITFLSVIAIMSCLFLYKTTFIIRVYKTLQNIPIENCDIQYTTPIIGSLFTNN